MPGTWPAEHATVLSDAELDALVGHRFPGGRRIVEHWEDWLLTVCTPREPMADRLLHPVVLFHLPIQTVQTSVAELFELGGSDGTPGSVTLLGYDWQYLRPMREEQVLVAQGGVVSAERRRNDDGAVRYDDVAFSIELSDEAGEVVARVTNHWRFRRGEAPSSGQEPVVGGGAALPAWTVDDIGADRMKTMAVLLRDPYPIHWDPEAVRAAGHGDRPVNQGPLNLSYIANMLMQWAGDGSIRRLTVAFHGRVFAGETVVAGGSVERTREDAGERLAECAVWLDRDGERLVSGTALVVDPRTPLP